jgi:glycosyltransferase involved in cell wall biosynthesis
MSEVNISFSERQIREFISSRLFDEDILRNKNNNYPKISIVIPSYNKGQYIENTILSILNQNYPNLECIIIDGGSLDETISIIKRYEKFITYWVSEKDNGQSDALNKGFLIATGDLVNEQDADDIFLPNAFLKIAEVYRRHPDADVIYGNRADIDDENHIIDESKYTKFSKIVYRYEGLSIGPQSAFWKRELFSKIGMYEVDLNFAMDYDFFMRAALKNAKFLYVPYCFSAMRRYEGSKTFQHHNTPPHKQECEKVDRRYGKIRMLNIPLKVYALAFRTINYIIQGDGAYVFRGCRRRFNNLFPGRDNKLETK